MVSSKAGSFEVLRRARRQFAHGRVQLLVSAGIALSAVGCGTEAEPLELDATQQEARVDDYLTGTCSTSVVLPLSIQIADEVRCVAPGTLVPFEERDGIVFNGGAVVPFLTEGARDDLYAAAASTSTEIRINSAMRTVVQQYLLYEWYQRGRCGITAAATPGRSNHESGRALDIGNWSALTSTLASHGWIQTVPGDEVHFDHTDSPDLRGYDVLAFQRLWNRNNPGDLIDEDGQYGPQTASRLAAAPPGGFPIGGCGPDQFDAELVAVDAPSAVASESTVTIAIELRNTGDQPWQPGSTYLGTTEPFDRDSALYDPDTWFGPNRPATVAAMTQPGEVGRFELVARAPAVEGDMALSESFGLVEEGVTWFGPSDVRVELVVTSGDVPDDPDDPPFDDPGQPDAPDADDLQGGCSTGGRAPGTPGALMVLVALAWRRRRR